MNSSSRSEAVPFIQKACGLDLREFQIDYLNELFREENGERVYTAALWGMPRGNGKTELAAAVALKMLIGDGRKHAQVIIAAGSRDQAAIAFQSARRMVTASPVLGNHLHVLPGRKIITHPASDSELKIVSREGPLQHGLRPSAVIFDELWNQPDRELWDALVGGLIKVPEPVQLCISTAGYDAGSLLADECKRGENGEDPRFLYRWHGLPKGSDLDYRDPATWKAANPAMACERPFLAEPGVRDSLARMHEAEFRRWHLNQWTETATMWLPFGAWDELAKNELVDGEVFLAFAGTYDNNAVGIVGCTRAGHIFTVDAWEGDVPRAEVDARLRTAMKTYRPKRLICDPLGWYTEIEAWTEAFSDRVVVEFDWQHQIKRKAEACSRFYTAVTTGQITHDGDPRLRRHLNSVVVKEHREGAYVGQGGRVGVPVVLATAAIMAYDQISEPVSVSPYERHGLRTV